MNTPILFLIFNRPDTTKLVFNKIREIKPRKLFIAADGPRKNIANEFELCQKTRSIINIDWDCEVNKLYRDENLGCGKAVKSAIDWFFNNVNQGIILEDDCLPNNSFFIFCEKLLEKYKNNKEIMIIGGNNFQQQKWGDSSYYFSAFSHIWGWATWKRVWDNYKFDVKELDIDNIEKVLQYYFNNKKTISYFKSIYKKMSSDKPIDTWDYQLTFSIWKNQGLSIIPNVNLVKNIGFDSRATHTRKKRKKYIIKTEKFPQIVHPSTVTITTNPDLYYERKYLHQSLLKKIIVIILKFFKII